MSEPKRSASRGSTTGSRPSISNITPSKVPSKVASKVMSAVDLTATKDALMTPLKVITGQPAEEYDPHKHRNVPNPTSYSETMTHMLKACFGVGMLAMPHAFSRLGLIFGTLGCCFLGFFATYCIQLLVLAQYKVCKKHKIGYLSYPKTMRVALKEGPPCMRWTAVPFAVAVDGFLILWQFGVCAVFLVFVAENIRENIVPPTEPGQPADQSEVLLDEPSHEMQKSNFAAFDGDSVQDNLAQISTTSISQQVIEPAPGAHSPEAEENMVLHSFGVELTVRIMICCLYPPLVIMCLTKNLKVLAPLSTFSNVCNMFGVALVFYYLIHDNLQIDDDKYKLKSLMDIPIFIGIVLYALEAVGVILALEYNMENPKEFTGWCGLLSIGMIVIVLIYCVLGIFGYLKYGMEAKASITLNLPQTEKKAQMAHLAFAATIFTSYPLQNYVAWQIIWGLIQDKFTEEKKYKADMTLRVVCSTFPFVLAVAAPTLGPFIGLLGSLCLTTAAILFPAVLDISVYYPNDYGFCYYKLIIDIFIILFGAFCCFSGCYVSLLEMIETLS